MSAKRYFKFDEFNQYLDNEADINYFSANQARRVAIGNMLGDYDENGYYVVDEEIIKELVAMPKLIVDSLEGIDLLRGAIKFDNFIHFMLAVEDDKAKLVLLEKINFESNIKENVGRYSNMNEYVLQEISIPDRDVDKNVIYSKFNIKREDEGMLYDFKDLNETELNFYKGLIKKMKYNALVQTTLLSNEQTIEIIEADYFDNVLNSFDKYVKYKEEFIKFLKAVILEKERFIQINKPFFQKTVNEILDSSVSLFLSKLPAEIRVEIEEKIRKVKEKYFYEFNKIMHLQFIFNENARANENSFIANIMSTKRDANSKLISLEIDKEKLKESYLAILEQKDQAKQKVDAKNADKKTITDENPTLSKFFGEIKKESGNDLLQPKTNEETNKVNKEVKKETAKPVEPKIAIPTKKNTNIIGRRSTSAVENNPVVKNNVATKPAEPNKTENKVAPQSPKTPTNSTTVSTNTATMSNNSSISKVQSNSMYHNTTSRSSRRSSSSMRNNTSNVEPVTNNVEFNTNF